MCRPLLLFAIFWMGLSPMFCPMVMAAHRVDQTLLSPSTSEKHTVWNNPYPIDQEEPILYGSFAEEPKHLDPAISYSSNEIVFIGQIYESLFQYHFLKRPHQLIPLTATALPNPIYFNQDGVRITSEGDMKTVARTVYRITLLEDIFYQPHPAFAKDKDNSYLYHHIKPSTLQAIDTLSDFPHTGTRKLVAEDYIYQIKRLVNPINQSPISGFMQKYIVGLEKLAKQLRHAKQPIDLRKYSIAGARALDDYTLEITINGYYPQFLYWLSMTFFSPMPWEAEAFFNQPGMQERNLSLNTYPVGTGAFMMQEHTPNFRIVLVKNPNFHGEFYPYEGSVQDKNSGFLEDAGKSLPRLSKAIYSIEKENIPAWNKFLQGYYDSSGIDSDVFEQVVQFNQGQAELTPAITEKAIALQTETMTSVYYMGFNMLDSIVGGYSEEAKALRHAISIAIDYEEYISIFANGRGVVAHGPLPPGILGYDKEDWNPVVFEKDQQAVVRKPIETAKQLLAKAGYKNGVDPKTGHPLILYLDSLGRGPGTKALFEWYRKQFSKLDITLIPRITDYNRFQNKMRQGKAQLFIWGWNADYPDPENFFFLLYGQNGKVAFGGENAANYQNDTFDRLYQKMQLLTSIEEKEMLIEEMLTILRADAPWIWGYYPVAYALQHAWYKNGKMNLVANNTLKYKGIDASLRAKKIRQWNQPATWLLWSITLVIIIVVLIAGIYYYSKENRAIQSK